MNLLTRYLYVHVLLFTLSCQQHQNNPNLAYPASPPEQNETNQRQPRSPEDLTPVAAPRQGSAEQVAIPWADIAQLNATVLPVWTGSLEQLNALVKFARYERLFENPNPGGYLRRAPWFYGGGCYAKAALISSVAEKDGFPRAGKVFAFGGWATLRFKSKYMPKGAAWWSYHVVAAYQYDSQVVILDPLINQERVLTVAQWIKAIAPRPEKISIAYCDQNIYSPEDRCLGGSRDGAYTGHIPAMLQQEYKSLKSLGYHPDTVL